MRGQLVVVKDVNGDMLVRRIWDISTTCVFIHSEDQWVKRMNGETSLDPVGFPIKDVFIYDERAKRELEGPTTPDPRNFRPVTAMTDSRDPSFVSSE